MRVVRWIGGVLLAVSCVGCGGSPTESVPVSSTTEVAEPPLAKSTEPITPEVTADIKSWKEVQEWVASQRGKVVVLDIWSNSCLECLREFPHFVQLHDELHSQVACASLNVDHYGGDVDISEELKPGVLKFLVSRQASMQNFISSDADEDIYKEINTASIPAAVVYDRDGKLHTVFNNDEEAYGPSGFNYEEHITPLVKQLLAADES